MVQQPRRHEGCVQLLMCPPDHFDVTYEINPWMDRKRGVDKARARQQWDTLRRVLAEEVGAAIDLVPPVPGLPDLVFTANAGLAHDNVFIASRFRHPERAREEAHWRAWFAKHGYELVCLPPDLRFEGEGDLLRAGELLVAGYRFRSDQGAAQHIGRRLQMEVLALELADPWFYHLDTCLCPLTGDTVLYYPQAFTPKARLAIQGRFPDAVPVETDEALRLACNAVVIGRHVIMSPHCPLARAELEARGYTVHEVDVSEFWKAGGGAKCLVLLLTGAVQPLTPALQGQQQRGLS